MTGEVRSINLNTWVLNHSKPQAVGTNNTLLCERFIPNIIFGAPTVESTVNLFSNSAVVNAPQHVSQDPVILSITCLLYLQNKGRPNMAEIVTTGELSPLGNFGRTTNGTCISSIRSKTFDGPGWWQSHWKLCVYSDLFWWPEKVRLARDILTILT